VITNPAIPDLLQADPQKRGRTVRILLTLLAVVVLGLGVVAWILPFLSGIPLFILGLTMLGMASRRVAIAVNAAESRLPTKWRLWLRPTLRSKLESSAGEDLVKRLFESQKEGANDAITDNRR